ncbi:TetR/AcrR family transcriptional regulator [Flindersiella endophytica]
MSQTSERGLRADALRNRVSLLAAASKLFVERGPDVSFVDIAKAAGVGVGTIYRHFPTREALIEAAYRSELDAVCEAAPELLGSLPPDRALRGWMDRFMDYVSTKVGMSEAIKAVVTAGGNPYAQSRERLGAAMEVLLSATAAAGATRPGIDPEDVLLTLSGIAMAAATADRERAGRMLDLLYEGLRTHD